MSEFVQAFDAQIRVLTERLKQLKKEEENSLLQPYEFVMLFTLFQRALAGCKVLKNETDAKDVAQTSVHSFTSKRADKGTLSMLKQEFESCLHKVVSANRANRHYAGMLMEAAVWKNVTLLYDTFANSNETKAGGAIARFDRLVTIANAKTNAKEQIPLRSFILKKNEPINGTSGLQVKVSGINMADYIVQANDPVGTIFDFILRVELVTRKAQADAGKLTDEVFGVKSGLPTWEIVLSNSKDNYQEESLDFLRAVLNGLVSLGAKATTEEEFASLIEQTYIEEGKSQINVMAKFRDDMRKSYEEKKYHLWLLACARSYFEVKRFAEDNLLRGADSSINRILKAGQMHLDKVITKKWGVFFTLGVRRSTKKRLENQNIVTANVRLAYTSVIKVHKSEVGALLGSIVQKATVNNARLKITGALIVAAVMEDANGSEIIRALQVLEGPKENVLSLYDVITKDVRHEQCTLLVEPHSISTRRLGDWTMQPIDYSRWNYLVETAKLD